MWEQFKVSVSYSRKGNNFVKHKDKVYVCPDLRLGTAIVSQDESGAWVKVGRITLPNTWFIGRDDQKSYNEMIRERGAR